MMNDLKKETIAAFDFDGTITTKDTLFDFICFYHGYIKLIIGLIILSPMLILFKIGLLKNNKAKEILFSYFFKGKQSLDFNLKCSSYARRIKTICRQSILDQIDWHLQQKHTVVIISASIKNWIEPWALEKGIKHIISTELNIEDNIITGTFKTKNCYGPEKTKRLLEIYPNRNQYFLYAYGDSSGDRELLKLADQPHLVKK